MSTSRWRWTPECDRGICIGDCDLCDKEEIVDTIEIVRRKEKRMSAEEMLEKVQDLKEQVLLNNFQATEDVVEFFNTYWMQILDMLDDALYEHLRCKYE